MDQRLGRLHAINTLSDQETHSIVLNTLFIMKKGHYSDINSPIASSPNPVKRARHTSASTPQYGNPSPSHDNQFKTLYSTKILNQPWIGEGLDSDVTRVVGMMSSKLSISTDDNDGTSVIQRSPMGMNDRIELCERVKQLEWSHGLDVEFVAKHQ